MNPIVKAYLPLAFVLVIVASLGVMISFQNDVCEVSHTGSGAPTYTRCK